MFVLDETAGPWDLKLGDECYAMSGEDAYFYLGVLYEINGLYAKVTFDPNRGSNHQKSGAPPTGTTRWVPLNDVCNVSWGIGNFYKERYGHILKQYYPCSFGKQLPDGRLLVYDDGDTDLNQKTTYDMLRLYCAKPDAIAPSAVAIHASVNGEVFDDFNARVAGMQAKIRLQIDEALGVDSDEEYALFGGRLFVSGDLSKQNYMKSLHRNYYEKCTEAYRRLYGKHDVIFGSKMQEVFDCFYSDIVAVFTPVYEEISAFFQEVGIAITPGKFFGYYEAKVDYAPYNEVVRVYNDLVKQRNAAARVHNNTESSFTSGYALGKYMFSNPDQMYGQKETIELLLMSVERAVNLVVYDGFTRAVNDYLGETYFDTSMTAESPLEAWEQYNAMDLETQKGPDGLNLLLHILGIDPYDQVAYQHLMASHSYPGCGLTEFIDVMYPAQNVVGQLKWRLLSDWISQQSFYPQAEADSSFACLHDHCERMQVRREDAAPVFALEALVKCAYALHNVANRNLLWRFDWGLPYDEGDRRELAQMVQKAMEELRGEAYDAAGQPYREALLSVCGPLLELIDADSRTVWGTVFDTCAEGQKVRDGVNEFTEYFWAADFSSPGMIVEIDRMIDEHPHRGVLAGHKEKIRRYAALKPQIEAFLAEAPGGEYQTRQKLIYDLMRGKIFDYERCILWVNHQEIYVWCDKRLNEALTVFGREFSNLDDANAYYYDTMEKAWIYQEYLNEKHNPQAGFFKKIGNAVSGISKKGYEAEYLMATGGGSHALAPIAENEKASVESYWQYWLDERRRLYQEYCERYDPTAIPGRERMAAVKNTLNSILCASGINIMRDDVLNSGWTARIPESVSETDGLGVDGMTEE